MVGNVIDGKISSQHVTSQANNNGSSSNVTTPSPGMSGGWSEEDREKIMLSATLSLVVGIMQVIKNFGIWRILTIRHCLERRLFLFIKFNRSFIDCNGFSTAWIYNNISFRSFDKWFHNRSSILGFYESN